MDPITIINLIATLVPVAESVGLDIVTIIQGLKAGKTAAQLAVEAAAKRNDLPDLTFGV
jgi:hypothetical protein